MSIVKVHPLAPKIAGFYNAIELVFEARYAIIGREEIIDDN